MCADKLKNDDHAHRYRSRQLEKLLIKASAVIVSCGYAQRDISLNRENLDKVRQRSAVMDGMEMNSPAIHQRDYV